MMGRNNLIVITGPTGVGKTELCLDIAKHYGIDIINADSRQIYSEIPIGTAAPTKEQMQSVKHHFVGTKHIGEYYSASMYEQDVLKLLEHLEHLKPLEPLEHLKPLEPLEHLKPLEPLEPPKPFEPSHLPLREDGRVSALLTGGSMMYIDAVCNGIDDIPTIKDEIRELVKQRLHNEGLETLLEELHTLDPEYWSIVDRKNPRRVVHALEICLQTGKTYTSLRKGKKKERPFNIIKIGLTRDTIAKVKRDQVIMDHSALYKRIDERVLQMVEAGIIDEAKRMYPYRDDKSLNTIGFKELFRYFDGEITLQEAIRQIQSNSREYARKQLTWYKKDKDIKWFHPDNYDEIIQYIDNYH